MTPYPYSHSYNKVIKLDRLSHLFGMLIDFYLDTKTFFSFPIKSCTIAVA